MSYLPVALNLSGKSVVIIGGGKVASRKVKTLLQYDAEIRLFAPDILETISSESIQCEYKEYTPDQLEGAAIVYAATDNRELNRTIVKDARKLGALANTVDDPSNCDFISPAIERRGDMSIAVTSNGTSVSGSIEMRNRIREVLND